MSVRTLLFRFVLAFPLMAFFALAVAAQFPPVSIVYMFGLRGKVSEKAVRDVVRIEPGADAMKVMIAAESTRAAFKKLSFVADASVNFVCCEDREGKSIMFIGVREEGNPAIKLCPAAKGAIRLPEDVVVIGKEFDKAFDGMIARKSFTEDDTAGHTLFNDPGTRPVQEKFPTIAKTRLSVWEHVLRESGDEHHRQYAAQMIAYHPDKRRIVRDLIYAVDDADSKVRNNATRALIIIAQHAQSIRS